MYHINLIFYSPDEFNHFIRLQSPFHILLRANTHIQGIAGADRLSYLIHNHLRESDPVFKASPVFIRPLIKKR